ncbi:MAG: hypothetical protein PVJ92_01015, partial [Candidatus Dependentiae bacterium]
MSLIRPRCYSVFFLCLVLTFSSALPSKFSDALGAFAKQHWHINHWDDTKDNFEALASSGNPVYEVLYAWTGVDDPLDWDPSKFYDITDKIKSALRDGRILIGRQVMSSANLTSELDFAPNKRKSWGIVYRDKDGVHFRRGPLGTGIALPALTAHANIHNHRGWGGWFMHHQLEETDRGLVTYTCNTNHDNNMNLSDERHIGAWAGFDHYHHNKDDHRIYQFACGGWNGTKSLLRREHIKYIDYNHNNLGHKNGNGNLRPDIYSGADTLRYDEWKGRDVQFWFAYDHGYFRFGEGEPKNEDELSSVILEHPSEVQDTPPQLWMRYFMFRGPGTYSNIQSRYLNIAKKFRAPRYLKGRHFHWPEEWKTETPGSMSLTFKARGNAVHIALTDENPIAKGPGTTSNLNENSRLFRIVATEGRTRIYHRRNLVVDTNQTYDDDKQQVFQRKGIGGGSMSRYYDYWLTIDSNVLTFGHGRDLGENAICQYNLVGKGDEGKKVTYYSFSCHDDETDYIDITSNTFYKTDALEATRGQFTGWNDRWRLPEESRGGVTFKARTISGSDKTVAIGLATNKPATPTSGATYSVSWGDISNSAALIKKLGTPVDQKQHSAPEGSEWGEYWIKYSDGNISYGTGSELDRNILGNWTDSAASAAIKYFGFGSGNNNIEVSG